MPTAFQIQDDFPPASYDQWRALAEADLKGAPFEQKLVTHTYEGIDILPLYTRRDQLPDAAAIGLPGAPPFVRGATSLGAATSGWDVRQAHRHPDLNVTNRAILDDLAGGVTSIFLRLDQAACDGFDPDDPAAGKPAGHDGLMAYSVDDFDAVLKNVQIQMIGVAFDAGAAFFPAAAQFVALLRRRKISFDQARGAFNADPFAVLAREGQLSVSPDIALTMLSELAAWTAANLPNFTAVGVDTSAYHHAGATAAQDIAFGIATAVEYLRAMTSFGLNIDAAAKQIVFNISLGTHHFLAIAKLRAVRKLWSHVVQACGGSPAAGAMRIHASVGRRVLTVRDPYVNLLRNTVSVFAAGLGGAESITSEPFDSTLGEPDDFSRRIARNTALVLQEESHLHRVIDPAGGSWFLDQLTQQAAEKAWEVFQQIEREGGMLAALTSGWVAKQIDLTFAPREKNIARRKEGITGVSEFPNVAEQTVKHSPIDFESLRVSSVQRISTARKAVASLEQLRNAKDRTAAAIEAAHQGATIGQLAAAMGFHQPPFEMTPLVLHTFAEPFEQLRDAADDWQATHGNRPKIFSANMGPLSQHTARATYAKNFFEAGGFEVLTNNGFPDAGAAAEAFAKSGAPIAVICSSDKLYPEFVPPTAAKLKSSGAKTVVLAGNPGANEAAWRSAGVDRFIFVKCDVLATLTEMLGELGVVPRKESPGKPGG